MRKLIVMMVLGILMTGCQNQQPKTLTPIPYTNENAATENNTSIDKLPAVSQNTSVIPLDFQNTASLDLDTTAVLLINESSHQPIYVEEAYKKIYPASLTKIMTALLVLEYGQLDEEVIVTQNFDHLIANAKKSGIKAGDRLTVEDLLNGLLINSGNDCAIVLAEHISGSVDAFAEKMNEKAKELGAIHTHFTNPHGLYDEENYTTPYDLYLIFKTALEDPRFNEIINRSYYDVQYLDKEGKIVSQIWYSTNLFFHSFTLPDAVTEVGGKTGFITESGYNLILRSHINDETFISLIIGAKDKEALYEQMTELLQLATEK